MTTKTSNKSSEKSQRDWKSHLGERVTDAMNEEIEQFESQLDLMKSGKLDEKLFMEARLRRGVYGQRYDNGQRHDGEKSQSIPFPTPAVKGPDTHWDAPGMQRIKIPYGKMSAEQLEVLAECAEEYSDSILHVTTRQDIQFHFIHIEDTPDMMRRLASVGITTREACGNSVRNVTACPYSGVCNEETFDVTPYADAYTQYFLGHPDIQDFGRKFKVAFSGCKHNPCGLVNFHDLGAIAAVREVDGKKQRGFEFYVGGGLGSVPQGAKLIEEFLPEEELLPMSQAVSRVFARLGEKKNRAKARVKFLVKKLGAEEFRRLVLEEREKLRSDPEWTAFLKDLHATDEEPIRPAGELPKGPHPKGFEDWYRTNVRPQRQKGFATAEVTLPLGDFTSDQARDIADLARKFTGDALRTTVEQNLMFRWVSLADLPELYEGLEKIGLAEAGAATIRDITSCPGTDTCKLGISASRGLAGELGKRLRVIQGDLDPAVDALRIKASGCFNSCGQHHVSDLGFLGVSRNVGGRRVPHFQVVLGGQWSENAGSYGLAIGAVPSKRVPEAVTIITDHYIAEREDKESFQDFIKRVGKAKIRGLLAGIMKVPSFEDDPSYYTDWGDTRVYTIGDIGVGECSGEVVPFVEFGLQTSEQEAFTAQVKLDEGNASEAAKLAFGAMLTAAKSLVRHLGVEVSDEVDDIVAQFREHLHETELFHDPFAKGKFASYLFRIHGAQEEAGSSTEAAHQTIEETQLFIEAAHSCYQRLTESQTNVA